MGQETCIHALGVQNRNREFRKIEHLNIVEAVADDTDLLVNGELPDDLLLALTRGRTRKGQDLGTEALALALYRAVGVRSENIDRKLRAELPDALADPVDQLTVTGDCAVVIQHQHIQPERLFPAGNFNLKHV